MKDQEEYDDYLVDKAKELLRESVSDAKEKKVEKPEMKQKRNKMDEMAEKRSTSKIPFSWDPQEVKHLANNRKSMSNEELEEFFQRDSELHEKMDGLDEWKDFTRWEERFVIQNYQAMSVSEIADQLGRDEKIVDIKMRMLGVMPE